MNVYPDPFICSLCREGDGDRCADVDGAGDREGAAVALDNAAADHKPESGAFFFRGIKRLAEPCQSVLGDPAPRIANLDLNCRMV
ncbi:hypothetical protein D3C86_1640810 [compost metagenome]